MMRVLRAFGIPFAAAALVVGCVQRVELVWPKEPLRVEIVNPGACRAATGEAPGDNPDAAVEKPKQPSHAKLAGKPVKLADSGTLLWVDYTAGNYGSGLVIYKADSNPGADDPCASGSGREEVWRLDGGQHWDAQLLVEDKKVLCAESSYADGEMNWETR